MSVVVGPYESSEVVLVRAVTNLHPGLGRAGDIVDLPVQKDNLGFPVIYASSLKGAMKSTLWQNHNKRDIIRALFGSDPDDSEKFTSALAVLDAFTVAFPVRSLEGVYAFVTSPLLLKRFGELLDLARKDCKNLKWLEELFTDDFRCETSRDAEKRLIVKELNKILINEEIEIECLTTHEGHIRKLEKSFGIEEGRLVVLSDDNALRAIERSLVRVTRVALDRETKRVRRGALWTEEYVPRGTIFATLFLYSKPRGHNLNMSAEDVKKELHDLLEGRNYLIIGGDETVGRGIVKLIFWKGWEWWV
ncbi:MAG: type III-B CRISPR module RAMP protein Cmr4 [Candidatus Korarchaeum sp.]